MQYNKGVAGNAFLIEIAIKEDTLGKVDIESKKYMRDKKHFADAFNYLLYEGKPIIDPEDLYPADTTEMAVPYGNNAAVPKQRYRDVLKIWHVLKDEKTVYAVLGVENQANIHYAMPIKTGLYDFMNYSGQAEEAEKSYRTKDEKSDGKDRISMSKAEFLSGFRKEDRLMPVITLVVHLGSKKWDGHISIHEMLNTNDETILKYVPDYHISLIDPYAMNDEEFLKFQTDFGKVLKYIKYSGDAEQLQQIVHEDFYESIDKGSADLINAATGSKLKYRAKEGKVNMCKAIDDMRNASREEGENKLAALMNELFSCGRVDDAKKAAKDETYRAELFKEFRMS